MASTLYLYKCYNRFPNYHSFLTWHVVLCLLKIIHLSNYLIACLKNKQKKTQKKPSKLFSIYLKENERLRSSDTICIFNNKNVLSDAGFWHCFTSSSCSFFSNRWIPAKTVLYLINNKDPLTICMLQSFTFTAAFQ